MKHLIYIIIYCILFACKNPSAKTPRFLESKGQNQHSGGEAIELNGGEKWKINKDMIIYIRDMEKEVISFSLRNNSDYKILSDKLQNDIDLLTSNCTMKGKAHDELHKWLLPYIEMADDFSKAKNMAESSEKLEKIKTAFKLFNKNFQ